MKTPEQFAKIHLSLFPVTTPIRVIMRMIEDIQRDAQPDWCPIAEAKAWPEFFLLDPSDIPMLIACHWRGDVIYNSSTGKPVSEALQRSKFFLPVITKLHPEHGVSA